MLWRARGGLRELEGHGSRSRITDMKFFPVGGRLVTVDSAGWAVVWRAKSGEFLHQFRDLEEGHLPSAKILEVQVFLDGDRFVTLGSDKLVVIWKISLGGVLRRLNTTEFGGHRTMRLLPEGDRLITAVSLRADGPAVIWDLFWGSVLYELTQLDDSMRFIEVAPCGTKLVSASFEMLLVWDVGRGAARPQVPLPLGGQRRHL
mmetsp:Transcript_1318/g.3668  ORF Transcript_1318/g.3668 Transcript_1318/m.3668 type:complete len:203 (-) Transcript_1318:385-993(-)